METAAIRILGVMPKYSVKPGRANSAIAAVGGVIFVLVCLVMAGLVAASPAPGGMAVVPVLMAFMGIAVVGMSIYNATARNRTSTLDITAGDEEPDPLDRFATGADEPAKDERREADPVRRHPGSFCPYCGKPARDDFDYCPACGKDI